MEYDFQQRVWAASRGPLDPELFWRMFNAGEERIDEDAILFPTTDEEFDRAAAMFEKTKPQAAEHETPNVLFSPEPQSRAQPFQ